MRLQRRTTEQKVSRSKKTVKMYAYFGDWDRRAAKLRLLQCLSSKHTMLQQSQPESIILPISNMIHCERITETVGLEPVCLKSGIHEIQSLARNPLPKKRNLPYRPTFIKSDFCSPAMNGNSTSLIIGLVRIR